MGWCLGCRGQPTSNGTKTCDRCKAARKRWREKNKDKVLAIAKRYRDAHPEKIRAVHKRWRAENPEAQTRNADIQNLRVKMRKHGASVAEFQDLMAKQSGACAICGSTDPRNRRAKRLFVDHCHATGVIRGLLCRACNSVLGFVDDDISLLRRAIQYLEKFK